MSRIKLFVGGKWSSACKLSKAGIPVCVCEVPCTLRALYRSSSSEPTLAIHTRAALQPKGDLAALGSRALCTWTGSFAPVSLLK